VSAIILLQQLFNYQNNFHKIYLKFGIELKCINISNAAPVLLHYSLLDILVFISHYNYFLNVLGFVTLETGILYNVEQGCILAWGIF